MPRGSDPAPLRTETPAVLRDMAIRAWRLAVNTLDQQAAANLIAFAAELEARAAALERTANRHARPSGSRAAGGP